MRYGLSELALLGQATARGLLLAVSIAIITASSVAAVETKCEYTKEDNNKDVAAGVYEITSVRLPVQMGTGYSWKVTALPDILEQETVTFKGGGTPGGAELQIFRFRTIKKGSGKLSLAYVRPWEQPERPQEIFTLNFKVD